MQCRQSPRPPRPSCSCQRNLRIPKRACTSSRIIEAMKLMNEIESDIDGEIVKVFPQNGQPVEYGEQLFAVRI